MRDRVFAAGKRGWGRAGGECLFPSACLTSVLAGGRVITSARVIIWGKGAELGKESKGGFEEKSVAVQP